MSCSCEMKKVGRRQETGEVSGKTKWYAVLKCSKCGREQTVPE